MIRRRPRREPYERLVLKIVSAVSAVGNPLVTWTAGYLAREPSGTARRSFRPKRTGCTARMSRELKARVERPSLVRGGRVAQLGGDDVGVGEIPLRPE